MQAPLLDVQRRENYLAERERELQDRIDTGTRPHEMSHIWEEILCHLDAGRPESRFKRRYIQRQGDAD